MGYPEIVVNSAARSGDFSSVGRRVFSSHCSSRGEGLRAVREISGGFATGTLDLPLSLISTAPWRLNGDAPFKGRESVEMSDKGKSSVPVANPPEISRTARKPSPGELQWEEKALRPTLEKSPERAAEFTTISGYPIRRLYTQADLAGWDPEKDLTYPGEPPYTRGIHATMHRGRLWTMRQFAGVGAAEDTNQRFRYLLTQGLTGPSVAFDLPTLMGYDSDHPLSEGEVGKCGVAISSLADMEVLFDQIPLADVTTSMTINSPAAVVWAMYLAVAEKQGADWKK